MCQSHRNRRIAAALAKTILVHTGVCNNHIPDAPIIRVHQKLIFVIVECVFVPILYVLFVCDAACLLSSSDWSIVSQLPHASLQFSLGESTRGLSVRVRATARRQFLPSNAQWIHAHSLPLPCHHTRWGVGFLERSAEERSVEVRVRISVRVWRALDATRPQFCSHVHVHVHMRVYGAGVESTGRSGVQNCACAVAE